MASLDCSVRDTNTASEPNVACRLTSSWVQIIRSSAGMRKALSGDTFRQPPIVFAMVAAVALAVVAASSLTALGTLRSLNEQRAELVESYIEISELSLAESAMVGRAEVLLLTDDPAVTEGVLQELGAHTESVNDILSKREELGGSAEVRAQIDLLFPMIEVSVVESNAVLEVGANSDALVELMGRRGETEAQVEETLDTIEESIEALDTEQAAVYSQARSRVIVVSGIAAVVLLVLGLVSSSRLAGHRRRMREREGFQAELAQAFDVVDDESDIYGISARVMVSVSDRPTELLVADDTDAAEIIERIGHGEVGGPGCGVGNAAGCMAIRRGQPTQFDSSTDVGSCPQLAGREGGACSAVCVPVSFMGRSLGVIHQSGPEGDQPSSDQINQLSLLAAAVGSRLGSVRAFNHSQHLARHDPLTGLMNRRALEEQLSEVMADGQVVAFAMGDVDFFKRLNDTFGHATGDKALATLARVLTTSLRSHDVVCRWGGEEFAVVMPGVDAHASLELLERVRQALANAVKDEGLPPFTVSFGLADTRLGRHIDSLVRVADEALYVAKETGRDRVVMAPGLDASLDARSFPTQ